MNLKQKKQYELTLNYYLTRYPIEAALGQKESPIPLWKRVIIQQVKIVNQLIDEYCELFDEEKLIINSQLTKLGFPTLEKMIDEEAEMEAA